MQQKKKMGRPRVWNREEVAQALLEWSKLDTSVNLCGFCATKLLDPDLLLQWKNEDKYFAGIFNTVKSTIAERREQLVNAGRLHVRAFDLNAKTYDLFLREEYRNQLAYTASLNTEQNVSVPKEALQSMNNLMHQLSQMQQDKKVPASDSNVNSNC